MRVVHTLKQRDTWEALNIKNITIKFDTFFLMGLTRESSDMSAFHGGKLKKALCSNASWLLVLPHCFAFSPGVLSSLEKKSMCFFSVNNTLNKALYGRQAAAFVICWRAVFLGHISDHPPAVN